MQTEEQNLQPNPAYAEQSSQPLSASRAAALVHLEEDSTEFDPTTDTGADVAVGFDRTPDDPYEVTTQRPFYTTPVPKLALVGTATLGVTLLVGSFLANPFSRRTPQTSTPQTSPSPNSTASPGDPTAAKDGKVLTALALTEQEQELKALNRQGRKLDPKQTVPVRRTPTPQTASPARVQAVSAPPAPQPEFRPIEVTPPPPPPSAIAAPSAVSQRQQDPVSEWFAAAQAGTFGSIPAQEGNSIADTSPTGAIAQSPSNLAPNPTATAAALPAVTLTQPGDSPANPTGVVSASPLGTVTQPGLAPNPIATAPANPVILTQEEQAVLTGQPRSIKSVLVGSKVRGTLLNSFAWEETGVSRDSNPGSQGVIALKDPLKAADGTTVLPTGSQLIARLTPSNSGLVQLGIVGAVVQRNGQFEELQIPEGMMQIQSDRGTPLMAKRQGGERRGSSFGNALMRVGLGAIRDVGDVLTRPNASIISNGGGFLINTDNSNRNILASVLRGGSDALLNDVLRQNQNSFAQPRPSTGIWFTEAGTVVEIVVNRSMQFDVAGL